MKYKIYSATTIFFQPNLTCETVQYFCVGKDANEAMMHVEKQVKHYIEKTDVRYLKIKTVLQEETLEHLQKLLNFCESGFLEGYSFKPTNENKIAFNSAVTNRPPYMEREKLSLNLGVGKIVEI